MKGSHARARTLCEWDYIIYQINRAEWIPGYLITAAYPNWSQDPDPSGPYRFATFDLLVYIPVPSYHECRSYRHSPIYLQKTNSCAGSMIWRVLMISTKSFRSCLTRLWAGGNQKFELYPFRWIRWSLSQKWPQVYSVSRNRGDWLCMKYNLANI